MIPRIATASPVDLRTMERHELALELRFSYRLGGLTYIGTGRTRNLGGETVCFETDQKIRRKGEVELRVVWPYRLQDVCQLELVVRGLLVRVDETVAVLRIQNYEFQTMGGRSFSQLASCGVTCNLAA